MHGDTNYPGELSFLCGTKQTTDTGKLVKLYQNSGFVDGWYCVTLSDQGNGFYWFVSNQVCEKPLIPTVLPTDEPAAVVSLKELEPYAAPDTITVELRPADDFGGDYEDRLANWEIDGRNVQIYRATDGNIYAAIVKEDGTRLAFLSHLDEECSMFFFEDLFDHHGFYISYSGQYDEHSFGPIYDFYYFTEDDIPILLTRCFAHFDIPQVIDLNGDGVHELVCDKQLFFQRDGLIYEARLDELLLSTCPTFDSWNAGRWDIYGKCLYANGFTKFDEETGMAMWTRRLYFDGEHILIYPDEKITEDHMVTGADDGIPAEVVQAAKDYVQSLMEPQDDGTWLRADREDYPDLQYPIDNWRVERFTNFSRDTVGNTTIEGWAFNYEFHTTDSKRVCWAGGMYVTEDGWVSPGYPGCDWLFFRVDNGQYTYLWHSVANNMSPGSEAWKQALAERAG